MGMSSKIKAPTEVRKKSKLDGKRASATAIEEDKSTLRRKNTKSQEGDRNSNAGSSDEDSDGKNFEDESVQSIELEKEQVTDDEMDLADVSSADMESDASDEMDKEDEDEFPKKKKSKMSKHDDGSSGFSSAVNAILSSHLKAYDRKDPIMARNKSVLKKNDVGKLEQKAKKAMLAEKKKLLNKTRKKDIIPSVTADAASGEEIRKVLEKERRLRKIAQKGVVKLFNVILATQVKTEKEVTEKLSDVKNRTEKRELLTELSKEKFLDLVKAAGDS